MSAQQSEQVNELAAALVKIQAEVPAIPKDANNPFFKSAYAPLSTVLDTASPVVAKHGVAVSQSLGFDGEHDTLTTMLLHTSGQWLADTMRLHLTKEDSQGHGSAVTYARRYAYMAALGLVADEDDDGNAAVASRSATRASRPNGNGVTATPPQATERLASPKQRGLINVKAAEKHLEPTDLADVVVAAGDGEPRTWESPERAEEWLKRAMDRLPARLVDPILERIAAGEGSTTDPIPF